MRCIVLILAILLFEAGDLAAQQVTGEVRVTYVAGANVYIDAGRNSGIFPGDTLTIRTETKQVARIAVVSSMSDRGVLKYIDEELQLHVGSRFTLVKDGQEIPGQNVSSVVVPDTPRDTLVEESIDVKGSDLLVAGPKTKVSGRLLVGARSLRSDTKSVLVPGAVSTRTYLTPYAMLWLDANQLPSGFDLRVRMRSEYRYASGAVSPSPKLSLRWYDLYLTRDFQAFRARFGRFSNQYVPTGGYWDGVQVDNGEGDVVYGGAVGFLPVRSNEQISFDMPKAALFARLSKRGTVVSNRLQAYYLEVRPTNDLLTRHLFGLGHRLSWNATTATSRLEIDRDPQSGHWVVTRLSTRVSSVVAGTIEAHGRFDLRQPYSMYRSFDVISYRRDQFSTGIGFHSAYAWVMTDFVWNYAYDMNSRRSLDGRSVTGSASFRRISGVGLTASASYWWSDFGASTFGMASLSKSFGKVSGRLSYQVSGSSRFDTNLTTHAIAAQASLPIGSRIRSTSRIRFQTGRYATSTAFETSISIRL